MIHALIGKKTGQTQAFLEDGRRVPVSLIKLEGNTVVQIKTQEKEGYNSVQVGFDTKRAATKPEVEHAKKAGIEKTPRFLREVRSVDSADVELGQVVKPEEVFEAGDVVDVVGTSKGKGFAGVVKRHHFKGGPRTHGQSDRERAPGSIGQTTTPGRVYKGKRMAGRMGNETVTIKNLTVLKIDNGVVYVKGLIPGAKGNVVMIERVGKNKKFVPLFEKKADEAVVEQVSAESAVAEEIISNVIEPSQEKPAEEAKEDVAPESTAAVGGETENESTDASVVAGEEVKE